MQWVTLRGSMRTAALEAPAYVRALLHSIPPDVGGTSTTSMYKGPVLALPFSDLRQLLHKLTS